MAYWEFLIQQEGDRSWLPLDTPDVEILEGRYRVVARSSQPNTPVEIRVTHQAIYEAPPKRRTQMRSSQTNPDGLMMVIPFTRLQPGIWELRCISDVMTDLLGNGWQHRVLLHVMPHDAQLTDDWTGDWSPGEDTPRAEMPQGEEAIAPPMPAASAFPSLVNATAADSTANPSDPSEKTDRETDCESNHETNHETEEASAGDGTSLEAPDLDLPDSIDEPAGQTPAEQEAAIQPEAIAIPASPDPALEDLGSYVQAVDELIDAVFQQLDETLGSPDPAFQLAETGDRPDLCDEPEAIGAPLSAAPEMVQADQGIESPDAAVSISEDSPAPSSQSEQTGTGGRAPVAHDNDSLSVTAEPTSLGEAQPASFRLQLSDETYVVRRNDQLVLQGQILTDALPPASAPPADPNPPLTHCLRIQLVDPQTGRSPLEMVHPLPQPLTWDSLPLPFTCGVNLATDPMTHLWLGTLTLHALGTDGTPEVSQILATQSFTVTVDLEQLLNAIANETPESNFFPTPLEFQDPRVTAPDLTFLNFLSAPPQSSAGIFQAAGQQVVPPQLDGTGREEPATSEHPVRSLDLPSFAPLHPDQPPSATDASAMPAEASPVESLDVADLQGETAVQATVESAPVEFVEDPAEGQPPQSVSDDLTSTEAQTPEQAEEIAKAAPPQRPAPRTLSLPIHPLPAPSEPETHPDPTPDDFQSLRLGDRFLSRLVSLAQDTELAEWLGSTTPQSSNDLSPDHADAEEYGVTLPWQTAPAGWDAALADEEVVIDDNRGISSPPASSTPLPPPEELRLGEDEPVPTPSLEVPKDELIAGQPLHLRLTLPNVSHHLYAKVWIHDCQQRLVVDGPHWVSNFLPNGRGQLEGGLWVTVPLGCMEARFEAIAVEMLTQRESRKVSTTRFVMPPNLPDLAFDELDV